MNFKEDELITKPKDLANQFLDLHKEKIATFFESHIRNTLSDSKLKRYMEDDLEKDLSKNIENEVEFVKEVTKSYERWSSASDSIVLWDVDDTMGKHTNFGESKWIFRPSLLPLMHFLQENFPQIKNGILSNRSQMSDQLDMEPMNQVDFFLDRERLYSSRDVFISSDLHETLSNEVYSATGRYPNIDHEQKLTLIKELKSFGLNIKDIDDNRVAESLGENGLYVGKYNIYLV